ncbi:MAG TPA: ATP-binding protein [Caproicibacter sp.]|nr:ATP-binding protein [Caproicibacter sp.]
MKKRLIIVNAVIIIVGFIAAFFCAAFEIQKQYTHEFTNRLDTALAILSTETEDIQKNPGEVARQVGSRLSSSGQEMRVSIISLSGKVIGDSTGLEIDQNHLNRPEIQQALKSGRGYNTRISASVGVQYYYEAIYVKGHYFLRAALPTSDLDASIDRLWIIAALSMLLGISIVCGLTAYIVYRVTEPLGRLTAAAKKIAGGDYSSRAEGTFRDEVGVLAESFNSMAQSTEIAMSDLKDQQNRLNGVLQGMNDGVIAMGKNNGILFLNKSAGKLLHSEALAEGSTLKGNLLMNQIAELMNNAVKTSSVSTQKIEAGDDRQYLVYTAPIPGQTEASLAVISDVTRLHKLERMRSEFVSNVTHELKTPLTSIRGSIELLKSADRDKETRSYFYDVLDIEAERLQHLIDDMLVLSRIENAKDDPSACACSVADAIRQCVERIQPAAAQNEITITTNLDEDMYVSCSPTRLQQLFGNLIENAVKYNVPKGSVIISAAKQKKTAVIRVKDTGIGIAKEHFDRLFERFYRVDASRSREVGGTGLGLSIVKHLAVLYGGEVSVESEVGEGSTFTVRMPLLPNDKKSVH